MPRAPWPSGRATRECFSLCLKSILSRTVHVSYCKGIGGAALPACTFWTAPSLYHHSLLFQVPTQILEARLKSHETVRNHLVFRITDTLQQPRLSSRANPFMPGSFCTLKYFPWYFSIPVLEWMRSWQIHPTDCCQICLDV